MLSFAVLCCVVGPLSVGGSVVGKERFERTIGKTNASPRLDSEIDQTTEVRVEAGSAPTKLFAGCKSQADTAVVRFRQVNTAAGEQYTRYVPQDGQVDAYDINWVKVTSVPITSFYDCSDFAEQNNKMMFKLDGISCYVSDVRLSTQYPKCGDSSADAFFVRTSCPEPMLTLGSLTPGATQMMVEWTVNDPCALATGYNVEWDDGSVNVIGTSSTNYLITGLSGCQSLTVWVIPLDSAGFAFGTGAARMSSTTTEAPSISNVNVVATGIVTYDVTWDLYDPCELIDSQEISYDWDPDYSLPSVGANSTATSASIILNKCDDNLQVTVSAYGNTSPLTSDDSVRGAPLRSTECTDGFVETCSVCLHQSETDTLGRADALSACKILNPQSHFLNVASAEEFDAAQSFLDTYYPSSSFFWVDLMLVNENWVWASGFVQPGCTGDGGTVWTTDVTGGKCGLVKGDQGFRLDDHPCDGTRHMKEMCMYV